MEIKVLFGNEDKVIYKKILMRLKKRFFLTFIIYLLIIISVLIIEFFFSEVNTYSRERGLFSASIIYNESFISKILFLISLFSFFIILDILTMTFQEYRNLHYIRKVVLNSGHRMSIEEVFENDNRKTIIEIILNEPGIHYNSLLRKTNIATGQLQWHLNVLINFEIITQKKVDSFLVFFASFVENQSGQKIILIKSKSTLDVLTIIEKNPGITMSKIAKDLNKSKSSIKYNIDKLRKKKLVTFKQQGRKQLLYVDTNIK